MSGCAYYRYRVYFAYILAKSHNVPVGFDAYAGKTTERLCRKTLDF